MTRIARLVFALAVLTFAIPRAASADDSADCHTGDAAKLDNPSHREKGVRACTRLIAKRSGASLAASLAARGSWLRRLKRFDQALKDVDRALSIDPKNVEFYDGQADIWTDKGELDRAIAAYDLAIRIDLTYGAAYTSRGQAYEKMGDLEKARASYLAALATPKVRARDSTGLQQWAHRRADERLKELAKAATK